ncbi:MAG: long-chain fatty acid--CoA ligase [Actinobacteria bacterium RBG_16_68_21]|nr:MAG: long-chain fatty acid--CoA ligase [Actinobacteria bacterium RBG_16_68_21]
MPARLFAQAERRPGSPALFEKIEGSFRPTSWSQYAEQVRLAARALIALDFEPGQHVAILGFNRPEWAVLDIACMAAGGAPAGIYITSSPEEVGYVTGHSESPLILVENKMQLDKVMMVRHELPHLRWIVTMRGAPEVDDPQVLTWEEFLARGEMSDDAEVDGRVAALRPEGLATLIYTSGTTGPPKGVMLTHSNLTWTADGVRQVVELSSDERLLSYLPLSHIAEQMFSLHIAITNGYAVYFAESIEALADNLKEVRPTVFFGVPRVWEKFRDGIAAKLGETTGAKAKIASWSQDVGRRAVAIENSGRKVSGLLAAQRLVASRLVHHKVLDAVGLDQTTAVVTAAAPISVEVLEFFAGFGLSLIEVYGQSEGSGPSTTSRPGATKFGSVGLPYPGAEVRLADDGEVVVKGGNVFAGYYKNPQATAETLVDGWLHSGDLGSFDADGFLTITGRKKDIIITAGGKNIAPKDIETGIKDSPLVSEAVLIGDRRKFLIALVTLDPAAADAFATERGVTGSLHRSEVIRTEIQGTIDDVNRRYARVEQVKKFAILPRELSIDDGELTGTLKVKRGAVTEHFAGEIESLYGDES